MKNIISLTKNAIKQMNNISKNNNINLFELSVKNAGCNGLTYNLNEFKKNDNRQYDSYEKDNIKLFIEKKQLFYLLGTKIDYTEDLMGSRFVFTNPQAVSTCGCNTSFSIKNIEF
jgi:iron-sulfur cluster assembly protein